MRGSRSSRVKPMKRRRLGPLYTPGHCLDFWYELLRRSSGRSLDGSNTVGDCRDLPSGAGDRALNGDQLRTCFERATDRYLVLVSSAGLGVDPREAATRGRVVRLVVNRAASVAIKDATLVLDAGPPFPPMGFVDDVRAVTGLDCGRLFIRERGAVRAARGSVGARIAGQRW